MGREDNKSELERLQKLLSHTNTYYAECIAEREDLRQENAELKRAVKTAVFADSAELKDCKAENERLREALKPFTDFYVSSTYGEDETFNCLLMVGDLRAARKALGETDG